jgi:hypothetical protein
VKDPTLIARFADIESVISQGQSILTHVIAASSTKTADLPTQQYLGGHAAVAISGIYEECVELMFTIRARKTGDKGIENFVSDVMHNGFRNPDSGKIIDFVKRLDPALIPALRKKISLAETSALDSIVTGKNAIAHGKPSTLTFADVVAFHRRATPIFDHLEQLVC